MNPALFTPSHCSGSRSGLIGAGVAVFLFYWLIPVAAAVSGVRPDTAVTMLLLVLPQLGALALALILRRLVGGPELARYRIEPFRPGAWKNLAWLFPASLAAVGATAFVWKALLDRLRIPYTEPPTELLLRTASGPLLICFFLSAVLLAPVIEEILFRDLIFDGVRERGAGVVTATAITALLFALLHNTLLQLLPLFVLGGVFQYARNRCGLAGAIALHTANNLTAFVVLFLFGR